MTFAWAWALATLLAVPILVGAYWWALRRRRRQAVRYSSVALIRTAAPRTSAWRRHLPVALIAAALAALGLAAARPQVRADVPVASSAVIVALDVSGSMCATDVDPNRLAAAQTAVRDFVRAQDKHTRIGLVVFSGFAQVAVAPTTEREPLLLAVEGLTTGRGTTIGAAILKSIDAIAQIDPNVAPSDPTSATEPSGAPVQPGAYAPEIVVLLTDGANTAGVSPRAAAKVAAERGVRVYPIGFGTTNPTTLSCTADQLGGGPQFGGPGFGGPGFGPGGSGRDRGSFGGGSPNYLVADEPTLRQVAETTGGRYFAASGADQLQEVLRDLPRHVEVQHREIELSVALAGLAVALLLGAAWAATRWSTFP